MPKLRPVYPYGLNEKEDICEHDKNVKRFKSHDIVGKFLTYFKGTKNEVMTTGQEYLS